MPLCVAGQGIGDVFHRLADMFVCLGLGGFVVVLMLLCAIVLGALRRQRGTVLALVILAWTLIPATVTFGVYVGLTQMSCHPLRLLGINGLETAFWAFVPAAFYSSAMMVFLVPLVVDRKNAELLAGGRWSLTAVLLSWLSAVVLCVWTMQGLEACSFDSFPGIAQWGCFLPDIRPGWPVGSLAMLVLAASFGCGLFRRKAASIDLLLIGWYVFAMSVLVELADVASTGRLEQGLRYAMLEQLPAPIALTAAIIAVSLDRESAAHLTKRRFWLAGVFLALFLALFVIVWTVPPAIYRFS